MCPLISPTCLIKCNEAHLGLREEPSPSQKRKLQTEGIVMKWFVLSWANNAYGGKPLLFTFTVLPMQTFPLWSVLLLSVSDDLGPFPFPMSRCEAARSQEGVHVVPG